MQPAVLLSGGVYARHAAVPTRPVALRRRCACSAGFRRGHRSGTSRSPRRSEKPSPPMRRLPRARRLYDMLSKLPSADPDGVLMRLANSARPPRHCKSPTCLPVYSTFDQRSGSARRRRVRRAARSAAARVADRALQAGARARRTAVRRQALYRGAGGVSACGAVCRGRRSRARESAARRKRLFPEALAERTRRGAAVRRSCRTSSRGLVLLRGVAARARRAGE